MTKKVIIMGAAGRDFHNFNTNFRDNSDYEVVSFTATQIPNIEGRVYPSELAGSLYPNGIPIEDESELEALISKYGVNEVVFSYSDVPYSYVMNRSSIVNNSGASFRLMGLAETWVESTKPVVSICAIRTGCGKSQTTRRVAEILIERGKKVVAIRHPMPYGDLVKQRGERLRQRGSLVLRRHALRHEQPQEFALGEVKRGHLPRAVGVVVAVAPRVIFQGCPHLLEEFDVPRHRPAADLPLLGERGAVRVPAGTDRSVELREPAELAPVEIHLAHASLLPWQVCHWPSHLRGYFLRFLARVGQRMSYPACYGACGEDARRSAGTGGIR